MAITNTTTLASAIPIQWNKELIPIITDELLVGKFANKSRITRGTGGTITLNRALRIPSVAWGNLAETTQTGTPIALTTNKQIIEPVITGATLQISKLSRLESIVKDEQLKKSLTEQIIRTLSESILENIYLYGLHHRVDNDATYEVSGTADSGSTTTLVDDALTQNDDHWGTDSSNWGYCSFTGPEGTNYDQTSKVTNFVASSDTCTLDALQQAVDSTSKYHLTRGTGILATDVISVAALTRVAAIMEFARTPKFKGGIFHGFIDAAQHQDLMLDTIFQTIIQYSAPKKLGNYSVYRVFDQELMVTNDLYREDVDGSKNKSTGVVYGTVIFGEDSFAFRNWNDAGDEYGIEFNFIGFDKADSNNYYKLQKFISWHTIAGLNVNRATGVVSLMTGATALPIIM
jgi:hypothetical protein